MDYSQIKQKLEKEMNKYNFIGQCTIYSNGEVVINVETSKYTYYPMHKYSDLFISLLIIKGLEKKNIDLEAKIKIIFPELKHATKISFLDFLRDQGGLVDLHGLLTTDYQKQEFYLCLTENEKMEYDINFRNSLISINEVIKMYNNSNLDHEPGSLTDYNNALQNIGPTIIERLFNKPYEEVLNDELLSLCNIKPSNQFETKRYFNTYPNKKSIVGINNPSFYFGLQTIDIAKLYLKLKKGKLISKTNFNLMKKLKPFSGINFTESYSFAHHINEYPFYIYDYKKQDVLIVISSEFDGHELVVDGETRTFYSSIIPMITAYFTKYNKPKLVKLNKSNVYDLLYIENDPNQLWFMGSTKYMLAYQYVEARVSLYLLMDNDVTVGTVSLEIDSKNSVYFISNVLIDAKYQRRGYGKAIIKEALKIFKKHGAKSITIYVEKNNVAAYKTYLSVGFKVTATFPRSYELVYIFD